MIWVHGSTLEEILVLKLSVSIILLIGLWHFTTALPLEKICLDEEVE